MSGELYLRRIILQANHTSGELYLRRIIFKANYISGESPPSAGLLLPAGKEGSRVVGAGSSPPLPAAPRHPFGRL